MWFLLCSLNLTLLLGFPSVKYAQIINRKRGEEDSLLSLPSLSLFLFFLSRCQEVIHTGLLHAINTSPLFGSYKLREVSRRGGKTKQRNCKILSTREVFKFDLKNRLLRVFFKAFKSHFHSKANLFREAFLSNSIS